MDIFGRQALRKAYESEIPFLRERITQLETTVAQVNAKLAEMVEPGITNRVQERAARAERLKRVITYPLPGAETPFMDSDDSAEYVPGTGTDDS